MASSAAFDTLCDALEQRTSLDRLAARGTVRLALKKGGLEPASVSPSQMRVVVDRLLPDELESRGIEDAAAVCSAIGELMAGISEGDAPDTPDAVFARLGG